MMSKRKLRILIRNIRHTIYNILRRFRLRTWIALGVLAVLLPIVALTLYRPSESSAEWFNDFWQYRKKITFGTAADTNKKVKFDLDTATLITNSKLQLGCQDVRFTNRDGKVLRHYLDSATAGCNDASSDYYALFPDIVAGDNVAYFYYGNPNATDSGEAAQFSEGTYTPGSGPTVDTEAGSPSPVAYLKFDEGVDTKEATVEQQLELIDTSTSTTSTTYTPTDNNLGLTDWDSADYSGDTVYFEATVRNTNGTGDSFGGGNSSGGSTGSVSDCPSSDNCKIAYIDNINNDLYFFDCDDEQCLTGTRSLLEGATGCVITGCSASNAAANNTLIDMTCAEGSNNCKIAFKETSGDDSAAFIDCDNESCSSGTETFLDGPSCVLTNCTTTAGENLGTGLAIDCRNGTGDCKIAEIKDEIAGANNDVLRFIDCNNEACSLGSVNTNVEGDTGCSLSGGDACGDYLIEANYLDMYCPSPINCKIIYRHSTNSGTYFGDCDDATCSSGSIQILSGDTDGTNCALTGGDICSTTATNGTFVDMECPAADDCKLIYTTGADAIHFGDCANETCSSGDEYDIDGHSTNTLTGAETVDVFEGNELFCISATDCKIAYYAADVTHTALKFADCDSAGCSSGNTGYIDGRSTGCNLTDCVTGDDDGDDPDITCLTATNCKVTYYDTTNGDLKFADCDNAACTTGTVYTIDTGGRTDVALYSSGGTAVTNATASTYTGSWVTVRSAALTQGTLPSLESNQNYTIRIKSDDATNTTAFVQSARLIVVQSGTTSVISATNSQIEIGNKQSAFTNTTYSALTDLKVYQYTKERFNPSVESSGDVEFHATLQKTVTDDTVEAGLFNKTDNTQVAEVSVATGTAWTFGSTANVDGDVDWDQTNSDDYEVRVKCTDGPDAGTVCEGSIANAKLVFKQVDTEGIVSFETAKEMVNTAKTDADATYTDQNFLNRSDPATTNQSGAYFENWFEATLKTSNAANSAFARLKNDSAVNPAAITGSEVSTASTSYARARSAAPAVLLPSDRRYLDTQLKNNSTDTTTVSSSRIITQVRAIRNRATHEENNLNHGDIYSATWKPASECFTSLCLFYDGSNDFVAIANRPQIDLDGHLASAFTFQFWVKVNSDGEGNVGQILYKGANTYVRTTNEDASGNVDLEAKLDLASADATVTVTDGLQLNRWHNIAMSYTDDGDDEITIYIDGKSRGVSTDGSGAPAADLNDILLGGSASANFHGFIDEFRVYKKERTQAEILTDLPRDAANNQSSSAVLGAKNTDFLTQGLVGYYKMDDNDIDSHTCPTGGTGDTCDASGNNNHGTDVGTMTDGDYIGAKYGFGLDFDGTDDSINVTDSPTLDFNNTDFTIAGWFNRDTFTADHTIIAKRSGIANTDQGYIVYVDDATDKLTFEVCDAASGCDEYQLESTSTFTTTGWNHFVITWDEDTETYTNIYINGALESATRTGTFANIGDLSNASALRLGGTSDGDAGFWYDGVLDDVRIYNRAFSGKEAVDLYSWGPGPFAYWNFNENTGTTTVNDTSGNAYNGTMTNLDESDWVPGPRGSALDFDGTDERIHTNLTNSFRGLAQFTISAWVNTDVLDAANHSIYDEFTNPGGNARVDLRIGAANTFVLAGQAPDGTSLTWALSDFPLTTGTWYHVAAVFDSISDVHFIYVNGKPYSQVTATAGLDNTAPIQVPKIGSTGASSPNQHFNGRIDEVKLYNYALSASQAMQDMNSATIFGGLAAKNPYLHWRFDEGYGDSTYNAQDNLSLRAITGDLAGTTTNCATGTTQCPTWVSGKFGKALDFDGTDDQVINLASSSFEDFTRDLTMSAWVNADTFGDGEYIMEYGEDDSEIEADNELFFLRWDTTSGNDIEYGHENGAGVNNFNVFDVNLSADTWYHITASRDSVAKTVRLYVDGKPRGTYSYSNNPTGGSGGEFGVGANDDDTTPLTPLDGTIDEVKVYAAALTQDEVLIDMNAGSSSNFSTGQIEASQLADGAGSAPVGSWNLNEQSTSQGTVYDQSGNNNSGTLGDTAAESPTATTGKYGGAYSFDGVDDHIDVAPAATINNLTSLTAEAWIYNTVGVSGTRIIAKNGASTTVASGAGASWRLQTDNPGRLQFVVLTYTGGTAMNILTSNDVISLNRWEHIAVTWDGSLTAANVNIYVNGVEVTYNTQTNGTGTIQDDSTLNLCIGSRCPSNTGEFNGKIDEVTLYNYVRTPAQVAYDFNRGRPIGWWKLDECQGTVANDTSGKGKNGTITIGVTDGNTATGTCTSGDTNHAWYDGRTGKLNASLDVDGTDDFVTVTEDDLHDFVDARDFTVSFWTQLDELGADGIMVSNKSTTVSTTAGWLIYFNNPGDTIDFLTSDTVDQCTISSSAIAPATTDWVHITAVFDDDSITNTRLYIDGKVQASTCSTLADVGSLDNAIALIFGEAGDGSSNFNGRLDDIRIYNYALSQSQINKIMRDDAGSRFGPDTGSP